MKNILLKSLILFPIFISCNRNFITYNASNNNDTIIVSQTQPVIIFEGRLHHKIKIYIDDSLYFNEKIINKNFKVISHAKTISVNKYPYKIETKIGYHRREIIPWTGQYKYIYISKNKNGSFTCRMSNTLQRYK